MTCYNNIYKVILFIALAACFSVNAKEKVMWKDSFGNSGSLVKLGWKEVRKLSGDDFKTEKGTLKALCSFKPYRGSCYTTSIPFIRKGYISFEANINAGHASRYKHLSLQFKFYNIMTTWSGYSKSWSRYYKKAWKNIGKVSNAEWVKYKIAFDTDTGAVEYYIGDMENPAMVDSSVTLKPEKNGKGRLEIGNYGLANDTVLNELRNIRLVKVTGDGRKAAVGSSAMLFCGVAFDYYQLDKIVSQLSASGLQKYTLITGLALHAENNLYLDKKPSTKLKSLPKYIIMADMPLGRSVPQYVQKMIADSVKNGSTLLILGGMFTLNKGEFKGSPVEKILPVRINSPWDVQKLNAPAVVKSSLTGKPLVKYLHKLQLTQNGKVMVRAGKYPFIVSGKYGKGKIIVCFGMPCGKFPADETPFWKWDKWPEFIADIMKQ
jgi:hypothetical protein